MRRSDLAVMLALAAFAAFGAPATAVQPGPASSAAPEPTQTATPAASPSPAPTVTALPAATLPTGLSLNVTGDPADAAFIQSQIVAALERAIRPMLQSGATLRYGDPVPAIQSLPAGFQTTYSVPVSVSGGAQFPSLVGAVTVQVSSVPVEPIQPALLQLDDDPEYVRTDGVLFRGKVDPDRPVRLYYYHENVGQARRFLLVLSAASQSPSRVQVIDVSAGPNVDVMTVGHAVSRSFVLIEPRNEGTVIDLASGTPFLQRDNNVGPSEGVAGAVDLRVLMGGTITTTVMAIPPGADPTTYLATPKVPNDGHNRHGTFDLSKAGQMTLAYTVGGPDVSFEYGSRGRSPQNIDPSDTGRDVGDYGIVERIAFDIANPGNGPATVYLYEQPVGGVVRNSFVVDGTLVEAGCARLSQRYQVATVAVPAQGSRELQVLTMPDGGSNYPVELGLMATPPLPTTPPLNAPDGCFPKPSAPSPQESAPPATPVPNAAPTLAPGVPAPPTPAPT